MYKKVKYILTKTNITVIVKDIKRAMGFCSYCALKLIKQNYQMIKVDKLFAIQNIIMDRTNHQYTGEQTYAIDINYQNIDPSKIRNNLKLLYNSCEEQIEKLTNEIHTLIDDTNKQALICLNNIKYHNAKIIELLEKNIQLINKHEVLLNNFVVEKSCSFSKPRNEALNYGVRDCCDILDEELTSALANRIIEPSVLSTYKLDKLTQLIQNIYNVKTKEHTIMNLDAQYSDAIYSYSRELNYYIISKCQIFEPNTYNPTHLNIHKTKNNPLADEDTVKCNTNIDKLSNDLKNMSIINDITSVSAKEIIKHSYKCVNDILARQKDRYKVYNHLLASDSINIDNINKNIKSSIISNNDGKIDNDKIKNKQIEFSDLFNEWIKLAPK